MEACSALTVEAVYWARTSNASFSVAATAILFETSSKSSASRARCRLRRTTDFFKAFIDFFQPLAERFDRPVELGLLAFVLKPHVSHLLLVLCLPYFELLSKFYDARLQLPNLVVCRSHSRLDVIVFLETSLLQFLTQRDDCLLEQSDFEFGIHITRDGNSHKKAQKVLCFFVAKIYLIPA